MNRLMEFHFKNAVNIKIQFFMFNLAFKEYSYLLIHAFYDESKYDPFDNSILFKKSLLWYVLFKYVLEEIA